jgi:Kdo2-lipid IVA lauroyltransferase/acyltransferase
MMLYALYRIGIFMALALPLKASYFFASFIAGLYYRVSSRDRTAVMKNLRVVLGGRADEAELSEMSEEVFKNFAKYLVDFFRFSRIDGAYIKKFVSMSGTENIREALSKGNGAILLSAHIGNWELGAAALSFSGYPVNAVVLTHQNKKVNDFFTKQRLNGNVRPIEIGASLKACYRTLKNNGLLALLGDRDFTKNGSLMNFFGKPAFIPKGPAVLAYRQGAAILPTFIVRNPDDSFKLFIDKPIFADRMKDESASVPEVAARYLGSIESCVRKYPTQWGVFKELWENDAAKSMRPDTIL